MNVDINIKNMRKLLFLVDSRKLFVKIYCQLECMYFALIRADSKNSHGNTCICVV